MAEHISWIAGLGQLNAPRVKATRNNKEASANMKFIKSLIAASALTMVATTAQAQLQNGQAYVNAGVDAFEFDSYGLSGKLGYNFNDYFGVEGQAGFGIGGDDSNSLGDLIDGAEGGGIDVGVDSYFAAFGRVKFPVTDRVEVFARGGYHFTQIGIDTGAFTFTDGTGTVRNFAATENNLDLDGFALGGGAQFMFDELNGIRLEYTFFDIEEIEDIDIDDFGDDTEFGEVGSDLWSIAYVRRF